MISVTIQSKMWQSCSLLLLATACLCQQRPTTGDSGDRQIRLEDIERDNLAANPKTLNAASRPPQPALSRQQQLPTYQQQVLLQQPQQYFPPTTFSYNSLGGAAVPLMIIPTNHLGVGSPIQAYFVPTDPQYFSPVFPVTQRYLAASRIQPLPQDLTYVQPSPGVHQVYRAQQQNFPTPNFAYAGTPTANYQPLQQAYQQPQTLQPQQAQQAFQPQQAQPVFQPQQAAQQQQLYNPYNSIYQQQQQKNAYSAGVKSTPSPPLKPNTQVYNTPQQAPGQQTFPDFKTFNYNQ